MKVFILCAAFAVILSGANANGEAVLQSSSANGGKECGRAISSGSQGAEIKSEAAMLFALKAGEIDAAISALNDLKAKLEG